MVPETELNCSRSGRAISLGLPRGLVAASKGLLAVSIWTSRVPLTVPESWLTLSLRAHVPPRWSWTQFDTMTFLSGATDPVTPQVKSRNGTMSFVAGLRVPR